MGGKIGLVMVVGLGIGCVGAICFVKEGVLVGVVDIDVDVVVVVVVEIEVGGGKVLGIIVDFSKDEDLCWIVCNIVNYFNGLDFIWNYVGYFGLVVVEDFDMQDWDQVVDFNLCIVFIIIELVLLELCVCGGGSLLFIVLFLGFIGSIFSLVYFMVKFGVVGLVKVMVK